MRCPKTGGDLTVVCDVVSLQTRAKIMRFLRKYKVTRTARGVRIDNEYCSLQATYTRHGIKITLMDTGAEEFGGDCHLEYDEFWGTKPPTQTINQTIDLKGEKA